MADRTVTVRFSADVSQLQSALRSTSAALGQADRAATGTARGNQQLARSSSAAGDSMSRMAKRAVAYIGVGAAIKSTIKQGADFQSSLNSMQAVSGATADQMGRVSDAARQLGNDVSLPGTSASTAAAAMTALAKGGLTVEQSMSAAKGTLQLAAAAQIDGAKAAEIQSKALNTFGLDASEAGTVADILANTANAASGEITDFAMGLSQVGLPARQMGIDLKDTSTALGIFANNGMVGSDAGTSLKAMLLSLASPTKQQKAALSELGVSAFDAQGNFIGLRDLSGQLADASARMTTEQFNAAASVAFGSDAIRAASGLAAGGAAEFDKMSTAVGRTGGAADLAAARMKGLAGVGQIVANAAEEAQLALMDRLTPSLETAGNKLATLIPVAADSLVPALESVITGVIKLAEGGLPLLGSALQIAGPAMTLAGQAASVLATMLQPVVWIVEKVSGVFALLPGPVQSGVAALGALVLLQGRLGGLFTRMAAGTGIMSGFSRSVNALRTGGMSTLGATFGAAGARLALMTGRVRAATAGMGVLGGSMRLVGGGLKGLMGALGGPVGLAITGITTAIGIFASKNAEAKQREEEHRQKVLELAGSFDELSGSVTQATTDMLGQDLASSKQQFDELGVSAGALVNNLSGGAEGIKAGFKAIADGAESTGKLTAAVHALSSSGEKTMQVLTGSLKMSREEIGRLAISGPGGVNMLTAALQATGVPAEFATEKVSRLRADVENFAPGAGKYREAAERMGEATSQAGDKAAVSAQQIQDVGVKAGASAQQMQTAWKMIADGGQSIENSLSKAGVQGQAFQAVMSALPDTAAKGADGLTYINQKAADAADAAKKAGDNIAGAGDAAGGAAPGLEAAADGAGDVGEQAQGAQAPTDGLAGALDAMKSASDSAATSADYLATSLLRAAGKNVDAEASARSQAAAFRELAASGRAVADAAQKETEAQNAANKAKTDGKAGSAAAAAADRDLAEAKDRSAAASDSQKEATEKAARAAADMATQAGLQAAANGTVAQGASAAAAAMNGARTSFIDAAIAAGMTKDEASKLADSFGLIPKNVTTQFTAMIDEAAARGQNLYNIYDKTSKKWTAQFLTTGDAAAREKAGATVKMYDKASGKWVAKLDADPAPAKAGAQQAQAAVSGVKDKTVDVKANPEPAKAGARQAQAAVSGVKDRIVDVNARGDVVGFVANARHALNSLPERKTITINTIQNVTKSVRELVSRLPLAASGGYLPPLMGMASGGTFSGTVPGPRPANVREDNVLAMVGRRPLALQGTEFVVKSTAAAKHLPLLNAINSGIGGLAGGGVPSASALAGFSPRQLGARENVTVGALSDLRDFQKDFHEKFQDLRETARRTWEALGGAQARYREKQTEGATKIREAQHQALIVSREQAAKVRTVQRDQARDAATRAKEMARQDAVVRAAQAKSHATYQKWSAARTKKEYDDRRREYERVVKAERAAEAKLAKMRAAQPEAARKAAEKVAKAQAAQSKANATAARRIDTTRAAVAKANAAERKKVAAASAVSRSAKAAADRQLALARAQDAVQQRMKPLSSMLTRLSAKADILTDRLKDAQDVLQDSRNDKAQLAGSIAGTVGGFGDGILGYTEQRQTAADVIRGMKYNLAKVSAFGSNIGTLKNKGLSSDLLEQLASGGVDRSGALVAQLAKASKAELATIGSLQKQIDKSAGATGNLVAGAKFDAVIKANLASVNAIDRQIAAINTIEKQIGRAMASASFSLQISPQGVARLVAQGNRELARRR